MSLIGPIEKRFLFVEECHQWVGVQEIGGNNKGQLVELFLNSAGLPPGNPWCMAFLQWAISRVDKLAQIIDPQTEPARCDRSAHCMTVWNKSPAILRTAAAVGAIVIWRHAGTDQGHAGVVSKVWEGGEWFKSVEGNTGPGLNVNRDGDGVFEKTHSLKPNGNMELVGFILPWR